MNNERPPINYSTDLSSILTGIASSPTRDKEMRLTKTEQNIVNKMSDGVAHAVSDLVGCLYDVEAAAKVTVLMHISNINKKIKPMYEIICIRTAGRDRKGTSSLYRLVRCISSGE